MLNESVSSLKFGRFAILLIFFNQQMLDCKYKRIKMLRHKRVLSSLSSILIELLFLPLKFQKLSNQGNIFFIMFSFQQIPLIFNNHFHQPYQFILLNLLYHFSLIWFQKIIIQHLSIYNFYLLHTLGQYQTYLYCQSQIDKMDTPRDQKLLTEKPIYPDMNQSYAGIAQSQPLPQAKPTPVPSQQIPQQQLPQYPPSNQPPLPPGPPFSSTLPVYSPDNRIPIGIPIPPAPVMGMLVEANDFPYVVPEATNQSPVPIRTKCPFCGYIGTTVIALKAGGAVWGWCLIMACFTGCCCIPFCVESCQDKYHYCSACGAQLGVFIANMC